MSNNITFARGIGQAGLRTMCQALNMSGFASTFAIVHALIPASGFGSFDLTSAQAYALTIASSNTGTVPGYDGYQWGELFQNEDWPNVYQILTETYSNSTGGTSTIVSTCTPYADLGCQVTNTSSGDGGEVPSIGSNDINTMTVTGLVMTITWTNTPTGITGTYTATLSNKWAGADSLSAWWSGMAAQATSLLANVTLSGSGLSNTIQVVAPISTGSGWSTSSGLNAPVVWGSSLGFALRATGGNIGYPCSLGIDGVPFAASIANIPAYSASGITRNQGFVLSSKSIWEITGLASSYYGDTVAPTSVYIQPMTLPPTQGTEGPCTQVNGSGIASPLNFPIQLTFSPSDITANGATYGVIGFRNPAA